jgi:hypothetical protein
VQLNRAGFQQNGGNTAANEQADSGEERRLKDACCCAKPEILTESVDVVCMGRGKAGYGGSEKSDPQRTTEWQPPTTSYDYNAIDVKPTIPTPAEIRENEALMAKPAKTARRSDGGSTMPGGWHGKEPFGPLR